MLFYLKLAWRNILRNKRRTLIAGIAIGIGLAAMIFSDAMMLGMKENLISSVTSTFMGDAQIHQKDFRKTQEIEKTINSHELLLQKLKEDKRVDNYSPRCLSFGMISAPANISSVVVYGIEPNLEKNISKMDDAIIEGNYLKSDNEYGLIIGNKLAEKLEVGLKDRIVITVSQAESGELSQQLFRISGIFKLTDDIEKGVVFVNLSKAQEMFNLGNKIHEIAIEYKNSDLGFKDNTPFTKDYSIENNEAANWTTLVPQMKLVFQMTDLGLTIMGIIIFGIVFFGIVNTLFMSLYERLFEFGVLRAIGTRAATMRKLIILEAILLSLVSIIIGSLIGLGVCLLVGHTGIDYRGLEFAGTNFTEMIYPVIEVRQFLIHPFLVFIFTVVISIYPAIYAGKMKIAHALRKTL